MKLLVVDHNALDPAKQKLYDKIVGWGEIEMRLVTPSRWFNNYTMLHSGSAHSAPYELFSSGVMFPTRTHRLIYLSLRKHLREFQPDILYMHSEPENFAAFQAALLKPPSTKLVFYTARNLDHQTIGYPYKLSGLHSRIEEFVLARATHGIACNTAAKKIFAEHHFSNVSAIPLSVDTQTFHPMKSSRDEQQFVIGYLGRLEKEKGIDLLIHSVPHLPARCSVKIIGSGTELLALRELAFQSGVSRRVEFVSSVEYSLLPTMLSQMDVVVLPSRTTPQWKEQFGRILIEAMACGVPVIGSTSGEIPNVIGDAGLLFTEGSVEGLVLGINRLLENPSMRFDLISRGLERVNRLFSLQVVARQHHKLFMSL